MVRTSTRSGLTPSFLLYNLLRHDTSSGKSSELSQMAKQKSLRCWHRGSLSSKALIPWHDLDLLPHYLAGYRLAQLTQPF